MRSSSDSVVLDVIVDDGGGIKGNDVDFDEGGEGEEEDDDDRRDYHHEHDDALRPTAAIDADIDVDDVIIRLPRSSTIDKSYRRSLHRGGGQTLPSSR